MLLSGHDMNEPYLQVRALILLTVCIFIPIRLKYEVFVLFCFSFHFISFHYLKSLFGHMFSSMFGYSSNFRQIIEDSLFFDCCCSCFCCSSSCSSCSFHSSYFYRFYSSSHVCGRVLSSH